MKKRVFFASLLSFMLVPNVLACGEITNFKTNIGTVKEVNKMNYIVTIPENYDTVSLYADTEYDWVLDYGPRTVSTTNGKVELKVNGEKCGYGIYTYFITFEKKSDAVAELTEAEQSSDSSLTVIDTEENEDDNKIYLKSLKIDGYDLEFDQDTFKYELSVDSYTKSISIDATPVIDGVEVIISDNASDLKMGENEVKITLKDENENTYDYIITVTRMDTLSSNNYIAALTINGYYLNFDSNTENYLLKVRDYKPLNFDIVTESEKATYKILNNSGLKKGSKVIIEVTAEDGSKKNYTITVEKEFVLSDYYIYIAVVGGILLIILLIINDKRKKKKKKTGPMEVQATQDTAGTINIVEAKVEEAPQNIEETKVVYGSVNLNIIVPSNVEVQNKLENSPTEVFKL